MRKRDAFRLLDTQMADPQAAEAIKQYIEKLVNQNRGLMYGTKADSPKQ